MRERFLVASAAQAAERGSARRHDRAVAVTLFALLFSLYLLTFSGRYHASDEMSMLAVTDSLARRGAWDIELLRWMGEQQGSYGPDGHLYGRKGIGTTLAALPHYWLALHFRRLGNVQTAMVTNSLVTALTGVLVYLLLRRLGDGQQERYARGVALATALAFGLATMAWPYARYFFSESLAGLGLMASFYFLVCYGSAAGQVIGGSGTQNAIDDQTSARVYSAQQHLQPARRPWAALRLPALAGVGLGLALLARLNNAIVAPFLGLLLLYYLHRRYGTNWRQWMGPLLLFVLPVVLALAIIAGYNWLRFADPLNTGYLPEERFSTPFLEGFYGLTLSPGKGLLWYNPLLFVALVAWPAFFRRHQAEALLTGAVVLANIAFYSSWFLWWAGHGWGPRFLVSILPFATLPLVEAFRAAARYFDGAQSAARRGTALALGILLVLSIAVQLLAVAVDFNLYLEDVYAELGLYHPATLFDPAYSPLRWQVRYLRPDNLDLAWAREGSLNAGPLLVALGLAVLSGLALWTAWQGKLNRVRCPPAWAGAALVALLGLGTLTSLFLYAPAGDVALAAENLTILERPGEATALTEPLLNEPFQDAYDGQLWVWGVPDRDQVRAGQEGLWVIGPIGAGALAPSPAAVRLQIGAVGLAYYPAPDQRPAGLDPALRLGRPASGGGNLILSARHSDGAQAKAALVAAETEGGTIRPGETLPLTLYWRALAPMDTSYTVFVQAIDEQGTKVAQVDRLPCDGGCPTTTWRPGDLIGETHELTIRPDAPPGRYELIAGMYDLDTGQRLQQLDEGGTAVADHLNLGAVEVQP
jgi:hypothetical protein